MGGAPSTGLPEGAVWRHAALIGEISVAFPDVFNRGGVAGIRLVLPRRRRWICSICGIVCTRCTKQNNWYLAPPRDTRSGDNGDLRGLCDVMARNVDRAPRRRQRPQDPPVPEEVQISVVPLADGAVLQIPSGDDMAPDFLEGTFPLRHPFGPVEFS